MAREFVHNAGSERDWILDWVETILVYKFPKLSREDIRMMLDLKDPDLKKSRFYQEVYAEGHEEGMEEGREEGRHGEALALVLRQLRRRLGPCRRGPRNGSRPCQCPASRRSARPCSISPGPPISSIGWTGQFRREPFPDKRVGCGPAAPILLPPLSPAGTAFRLDRQDSILLFAS